MRGFKITIFGMITVSLDMRTVTVFDFTTTRVHLDDTNAFRHCVTFCRPGFWLVKPVNVRKRELLVKTGNQMPIY